MKFHDIHTCANLMYVHAVRVRKLCGWGPDLVLAGVGRRYKNGSRGILANGFNS